MSKHTTSIVWAIEFASLTAMAVPELVQVFDYIPQEVGAGDHSLLIKGIIGKTYASRSDRRSAPAVIPREVERNVKIAFNSHSSTSC